MRIYRKFHITRRHKDIGLVWDNKLNLEAYGLYCIISARPINPLVDDIAKTLRIDEQELDKPIKELVKAGLIKIEEL